MVAIENMTQFEELIAQDKPVFLDFYADWCGPCKTLLPTVEKLADEYEGKVEIRKVNVDQNPELAQHFGVRSIPALFYIKDSKLVGKAMGLQPETELRKTLDSLLN